MLRRSLAPGAVTRPPFTVLPLGVTAQVAAFTGLATYDDQVAIDVDISEILLLTSPRETPLLDALPQPDRPATNVLHSWDEQLLGPDRIYNSTAINSTTTATGFQTDGNAALLSVGMLLEMEPPEGSGATEIVQISSIPGPNSLLVNRSINGNVNSLVAGSTLFVISTAELEGSATAGDVSRYRTQRQNYTQIFKKPIQISGSRQAVVTRPNVGSEMDHQTMLRTIELLKELEKAVIRGVATNSIGTSSNARTLQGLRASLTAINSTITDGSFQADPIDYLNSLIQQAWNAGARDIDLLVTGGTWGKYISATNVARLFVSQADETVQRYVETVTTDFGSMRKIVSPWMPNDAVMGIATRRVFVVPLSGRNFHREDLAKSGDFQQAQVLGEYTLEYHHPEQMFYGWGG